MKNTKLQYKYAVRRLKRAYERIQNDKLLHSVLEREGDIFQQIEKFHGRNSNCSSRIDNEIGPTNISNRFASIYENLYNSHKNCSKLESVQNDINKYENRGRLYR